MMWKIAVIVLSVIINFQYLTAVASQLSSKRYPFTGKIYRLNPGLDKIFPQEVQIEKLAYGFEEAEGLVWDNKTQTLLFSDSPRNVIFQWKSGIGTRDFLYPSGYTGIRPRHGKIGSAGLALDVNQNLLICQHGDRRLILMDRNGYIKVVASYYKWRRFNSPHDLCVSTNGYIYFTDPSVGLEDGDKDTTKELLFNGVYAIAPDGEVYLLIQHLSMPYAIAIDEQRSVIYITVHDEQRPCIMRYQIEKGKLKEETLFIDCKKMFPNEAFIPYGISTDKFGHIYVAFGSKGVVVFSSEGQLLGLLKPEGHVYDCEWGEEGKTFFMIGAPLLCRVRKES